MINTYSLKLKLNNQRMKASPNLTKLFRGEHLKHADLSLPALLGNDAADDLITQIAKLKSRAINMYYFL